MRSAYAKLWKLPVSSNIVKIFLDEYKKKKKTKIMIVYYMHAYGVASYQLKHRFWPGRNNAEKKKRKSFIPSNTASVY